jgi:bifunctional UDP-N-acetylglucosamine pyrophosphorylase/glucosamine-1-phosphate N-acetyltransferase
MNVQGQGMVQNTHTQTGTDGLITVVMAAGKGTRMRSDLAKVLHPLCGRPMVHFVVETALAIGSDRVLVVIGHQAEAVREALKTYPVEFVEQREQLGTGHAVMQAAPLLGGYAGTLLVLAGDTPLLQPATLRSMIDGHHAQGAAATLLTAEMGDPYGLGRIVRGEDGQILRIVEEKDATPEERSIREVNTSTYCFQTPLLLRMLHRLQPVNQQGEYYLTDTIGLLRAEGYRLHGIRVSEPEETTGINTPEQLAAAEAVLKKQCPQPADERGYILVSQAKKC